MEEISPESQLDGSNEKYHTLFHSIDEGFCLVEILYDQQNQPITWFFHEVNPAFVRKSGFNPTGKTIHEFIPNIEKFWLETYHNVVQTGESKRTENYIQAQKRWYSIFASRIGNSSSRTLAVVFYDITELKRREANQTLLVEISNELAGLDNITDTMQRLGEKIGRYFQVKQCMFAEVVDFETAVATDGWIAENGRSLKGMYRMRDFLTDEQIAANNAGELSIVNDTQTDSRVNAETYGNLGVRAFIIVPFVKGDSWRLALSIIDDKPREWRQDEIDLMRELTGRIWIRLERARAEEALRDSDARFRALALANLGIIYRMSADWSDMLSLQSNNFMIENKAPRTNWLEIYIPANEQKHIMEVIRIALRTKKSFFELEHRIVGVDGKERWVFSRAVALMNNKMEIIEWFCAATDITERRQIEQALKEADRRKDEFLAILAHELRNPLFPIKNAIYLFQQENVDQSQLIQIMQRQINHMICLIDDLLEVSRIATGKIELRKENISLTAIINNALEVSQSLLENNRHHLTMSLPSETCIINADMVRMTQIFANLLNNAAKYTPENGKININAHRKNDKIIISIRDNGIGITSELLPHVFEMFTQGQNINPNNKGLGVGLAMVRSLIELHEGTVRACSEGPNQGSEFIVCLPLATENSKEFENEASMPEKNPSFANLRILIVDDNSDITDSFAMLLRCWDITVHAVNNGKSALAILDEFNPHIILLDIGMPDMGGYEVAEKIRQNPKYTAIKLVALTGWSQEKDRAKSLASGFHAHLAKPVDIAILRNLLDAIDCSKSLSNFKASLL